MSDMDLEQKVAEMIKVRKEQDEERFRSMEKHPRCAILPSPEKLDESIGSPGSDKTNTLRDFDLIKDWVTKSQLLNVGFYDWAGTDGEDLEDGVYYSFIQLSFSTAFEAMRKTASPELEELVFWYYAGHGLSKKAAQLSYLSTPCLERVGMIPGYHKAADKSVKEFEGRKVKGGELCLHKVGFCDLYGLLKPWIDAVKAPSINAEGRKKNKHLVIILDSCYSGIIARELKEFEDQMKTKDPSFLKENSVTIQAACGPDEGALGGYFTPCFVYLNDPENTELLNDLKADWMDMRDEERNEYRSIKLPSPMVVSTQPQSQDVTLEMTVQNFRLTLFQDPGFFKFCSIMVYKHDDNNWCNSKERALDQTSATNFMTSPTFTVLDYKLKKMVTGPYAGSPMGLFLLEDPMNPGYAVCAHIHFQRGNTNNPQRINLVHHKKPPFESVLYTEDHDGLSRRQIRKNQHKIQVPLDANGWRLVEACRDYVTKRECCRWSCISRWNMTTSQLGVNGLFRVQERLRERSAWEDSYLQHIKVQNIQKTDPADIANNTNCCCWLF